MSRWLWDLYLENGVTVRVEFEDLPDRVGAEVKGVVRQVTREVVERG